MPSKNKTKSASLSPSKVNHAKSLSEKEASIQNVEDKWSLLVQAQNMTQAIQFQNSLFNKFTPFYYENKEQVKGIRCFCDVKAIKPKDDIIVCTTCKKHQHKSCIGLQAKIDPYIWGHWQFLLMDLINIPVDVIMEPVQLKSMECKTINFQPSRLAYSILSDKKKINYRIEIRSMRLSEVVFKNAYPNYGNFSIDSWAWKYNLTLPEKEQSRKRKDEPLDITDVIHKVMPKQYSFRMCKSQIPFGHHEKNKDDYTYIIGIFLVKIIQVPKIINFCKNFRIKSFLSSYNMIWEKLFPNQSDEVHIVTEEMSVPIKCPVTLSSIKIPVRGYKCTHIEVSQNIS